MSNLENLEAEILNLNHLLETVPFGPKSNNKSKFFLNVYRLNYDQLAPLNNTSIESGGLAHKFPINSNKLLKLGISLGNLLKSLHIDEEIHHQQQQHQQNFVNNLNNLKSKNGGVVPGGTGSPSANSSPSNDPFNDNDTIISNQSNKAQVNLSLYQTKFIKNLMVLLKNFDIGNQNGIGFQIQDMPTSGSNSTLNQYGNSHGHGHSHSISNGALGYTSNTSSAQSTHSSQSGGTSSHSNPNTSPIKLNLKQLLIEKLEINISLDNLFIFKIIIKLLLNIFEILKEQMIKANLLGTGTNSNPISSPRNHSHRPSTVSQITNDDLENSSLFSYNSLNSSSSKDTGLTVDEYYKLISQILNRINIGLIEPFIKLILSETVEPNISNDFSNLINNL